MPNYYDKILGADKVDPDLARLRAADAVGEMPQNPPRTSPERLTMRLVIDVTFIPNNTHTGDLEDNLLGIATMCMRRGLFTTGTDADVVMANPLVTVLS